MLNSAMRLFAQIRLWSCFVLLLGLLSPSHASDNAADRGDVRIAAAPRQPQPVYTVTAGMDGEIYPVFANYASLQKQNERSFGVLSLNVSTPGEMTPRHRIAVKVAGWSDQD